MCEHIQLCDVWLLNCGTVAKRTVLWTPAGMEFANVTTRRSTHTTAESKEILEMIEMYSKLSLDNDMVENSDDTSLSGIEEESPTTKEFLQTTSALLRTLGEKLVEKIDQITFLQEENVLLKTTMKMEINSIKEENEIFQQEMCTRFHEVIKSTNKRSMSSSSASSSLSSSTSSYFSTPEESTSTSKSEPATQPRRALELEEEIKFLKYEIINKNRVIDYLMDVKASSGEQYQLSIEEVEDVSTEEVEDEEDDIDQLPLDVEDESVLDTTMEIVERLLVDVDAPTESTLVHDETRTEEPENDVAEDDEEQNAGSEKTKPENTEPANDMSLVAPWDNHGNGFASNYMRRNGHQPGRGLGKSEDGITVPISAEQKTLEPDPLPHVWAEGTVLIAGASIVQGLEESKMSRSGKVKVRSHGGATIRDMQDHLNAILRKKPSHLILHVHSNDASNKNTTSDEMFDSLVALKTFAENKVEGMKVTLSCPILRTDNAIANFKQLQLKNRLKRSGLNIIENDGITHEDLGRKGLHLKPSGSTKLAKNILNYLRGF